MVVILKLANCGQTCVVNPGMVPFHLQPGSDARLQATKEEIISRLRWDMIHWEGFRPPLPGTNHDLGLGPVAEAFPAGVFLATPQPQI